MTFKLFGPTGGGTPQTAAQNCATNSDTVGTSGLLYRQVFINVGGAHSVPLTTTNYFGQTGAVSVNPTTSTTYVWRVTYAPAVADAAHTGIQSACFEDTSVQVTNDSGPGTAFP